MNITSRFERDIVGLSPTGNTILVDKQTRGPACAKSYSLGNEEVPAITGRHAVEAAGVSDSEVVGVGEGAPPSPAMTSGW